MKVKSLIKRLQKYDPEAVVSISHDEEGNGFHDIDYMEQDKKVKAVILWPTQEFSQWYDGADDY